MHSFGELGVQVHLDFVSDKKGETRGTRGLGITDRGL